MILSEIDTNQLASLLRRNSQFDTVYVPNSGNAGDSLIAEATYQFIERIGLQYSVTSLEGDLIKPSKVIVGGGGNLVKPYQNVRNFIERNLQRCEELIVLPHTILAYEDLLSKLDHRCTLICREKKSLDFCLQHAPRAQVRLGDDMALLWKREETEKYAQKERFNHPADIAFNLRNLKHWIRDISNRRQIVGGVLNAFRTDVEGKNTPTMIDSVDLSEIFSSESMARPFASCTINSLANFIDRADIVRTDRLHIAILSSMLGKQVEMHDNSYGKNKLVYEYSLASRFPNITFVG